MSGCSNAASITSGSSYVGGICASAENYTQIINCTNRGAVTASGGTGYVGGICGTVMNSSSVSITGCVNTGAVTAEGAQYVGGICGRFNSTNVSLSDCLNTGAVRGYAYVGGIVGYRYYNTELAYCLNTGEVSGTGSSIDSFCPAGGGTTTKCYSIDTSSNTSCTEVTPAQLESGEVAWLLQDNRHNTIWGQLLGQDNYPQPSGIDRVVKITVALPDGNTSIFYANVDKVATGYPDGYAFFEDKDCTNRIDTGTKMYSADTTIYAKQLTSATVSAAPGAVNRTYNGQPQELVTAGEADGGTMVYRLGDSGEFSAEIPTATNAGEYTVWYKAAGDDSHFDTEPMKVVVTIAPAQVTVTALDRNIRTGQRAPDLSAPAAGVDYEVSGLIGEDSLSGTVTMEYQKDGAAVTPNTYAPGDYDIAISCAGTNPNYAVNCVKGRLTITINTANLPKVYNVTVAETEHGGVTASPTNSSEGGRITVTVTPDEGYSLAGLTVTDEDGNRIAVSGSGSVYTFTMPGSDVTVTATFRAGSAACDGGADCLLRAFNDLDVKAWYHDGVHCCFENGLMEGTGAATFSPDAGMTRAMVWAILARMDGVTVTGSDWVETARAWAMAEGVSDGTDPMGNVTREQLVTMLWRFKGEPTVDFLLTAKDAGEVSAWAYEAMRWAVAEHIIEGDEAGLITPTATATRAQAAAILMRFVENVK